MADIACLGLLVADIVGRPIDTLPRRGTLEIIERIELHTGGNAANTGIALAKLGTSVAVLGKVGVDDFGDYLVGAIQKHGADVQGIGRDLSAPTSATIVTVHSDSERSFLHVPGANATYTAEDVNWEVVASAKFLYIAGMQLMTGLEGEGIAAVLSEAKARGLTTVLDTVMNPRSLWWDGLCAALPYLDWAIPSYEEAIYLTGEAEVEKQVRRLKEGGVKNVAIKQGSTGCTIFPQSGETLTVPALVVNAVDALGAGDCWAAGFLTGLVNGWPLERVGRFANAVGACCVLALGATTGVRSLNETLTMIVDP